MNCIGTNILSGDGGGGQLLCNASWFFHSILLRYQNTSTRMNTDSHTGRAVHSGERWVEMLKREGEGKGHCTQSLPPDSDSQLAQDAGSSMSRIWIQGGQRDLSSSPFCFSALQDSLDRAEAPGADVTSSAVSGPRDFNTFVFSAISVKQCNMMGA